ncbi:DUF1349 domain-containing protein [Streptomonospora litoralis]|uniref:DUF1349 domain-containing protein n=1 Tax=Streptomonospora litoralis TaxID=2498135 RepID=A0A4P6Q793_9ACTN|nr:DUF1349 domain-containing protein [Streptomonospora litoralis]QBI56656.1 hypothetical protein EKD16_24560 [Streptomonospora litoralis]
MADSVSIPAFPVSMHWTNPPEFYEVDGYDTLVLRAAGGTDLFTDPDGSARFDNAPALVGGLNGDFSVSALVDTDLAATFDAGVLLLYSAPDTWAKFCLEASPQGRPTIVSVVNRGVSDDCNSFAVDPAGGVRLRISRLGSAYAFHVRLGDGPWDLVRYFALSDEAEVGFLAQSPTGTGSTVRFAEISYSAERPADVRDGS